MPEDESPTPPPPPKDDMVSKEVLEVHNTFSPSSQSSEKVWVQTVEDDSKKNADASDRTGVSPKKDEKDDKEYNEYEYEQPLADAKELEAKKDIETGNCQDGEKSKRASFSSASSRSSESSGASELEKLKQEMTVRKSRRDIETLTLMAKLEQKKRKQKQRVIGLGIFAVLIGGILAIIWAIAW